MTDGFRHPQKLTPRMQQACTQPEDGKNKQHGHEKSHQAVHPHHVRDALFGGVIENGD